MATTVLSFLATLVLLPPRQPGLLLLLGGGKMDSPGKMSLSQLGLGGPETPVTLFTQPLQNTLLTLNTITPQRASGDSGPLKL